MWSLCGAARQLMAHFVAWMLFEVSLTLWCQPEFVIESRNTALSANADNW